MCLICTNWSDGLCFVLGSEMSRFVVFYRVWGHRCSILGGEQGKHKCGKKMDAHCVKNEVWGSFFAYFVCSNCKHNLLSMKKERSFFCV